MPENQNQNRHFLRDKREKNFRDDGILFLGYQLGKFFSGRKEHDYDNDPRVTGFDQGNNAEDKEKQKRLIKASDKLLSKAWGVEIIAATIGVIVAIATGYSIWFDAATIATDATPIATDAEQSGVGTSTWINIFLGSLPFIMVAIVELAKIPLARVVYNAEGLMLKTVFTMVLGGAIFITFETLSTGFERSVAGQLSSISKYYIEIDALEDKINDMASESSDNTGITSDTDALIDKLELSLKDQETVKLKLIATIGGTLSTEIGQLSVQIGDLEKNKTDELADMLAFSKQNSKENNDVVKLKVATLKEANVRLDKLVANYELKMGNLICEYFSGKSNSDCDGVQRKDFLAKISTNEYTIRKNNKKILTEQGKLISPNTKAQRQSINKKYLKLTKPKQDRKDLAEKELVNANKDNQQLIKLSATISKLGNQINTLRLDASKSDLASINDKKDNYATKRTYESQISDLLSQINDKAAQTNIYRLAYMFKDSKLDENGQPKKAVVYSDVSPHFVHEVAKWWFGGLAFVVSIVGTLMAFGSFVLRDWHLQTPTSPGEQISRTFNWFMYYPKLALDGVVWAVKLVGRLFIELGAWFVAMKDWILRDEKIKEVEVEKIKYKNRSVFFPFLTDEVMDVEMKSKDDKQDESKNDANANKTEEDTVQDDVTTDDKDK